MAASLAEGIRNRRPAAEVGAVRAADGGDGSLAAFDAVWFERIALEGPGATGQTAPTRYVRRGEATVVELAEVAGLAGLRGALAPLTATSRGLGELIAHALDAGCTRVLVGIGNARRSNGGLGLVQALGARVRDASGAEVGPGGAGAATAASLDLSGLHPGLAAAHIEVASDVDNPLTGPEGAAAVYGRRKAPTPTRCASSTRRSRTGPTSSPRRPATNTAPTRARARPAGSGSRRSRSSAQSCAPAPS